MAVITTKNMYESNEQSVPQNPENALQEKLQAAMKMVSAKSELHRLLGECFALAKPTTAPKPAVKK